MAANIPIYHWRLSIQSILARRELEILRTYVFAHALYPVHLKFKCRLPKVSVVFVSLPAAEIDLTIENGKTRALEALK